MSAHNENTGQLDLLADMGRNFADSGDIGSVFKTGLERIALTLEAEGGALFLLDGPLNDEGTKLVCNASFGPVDIAGLTIDADDGIVGRAVNSNCAEIVRDVTKDPNFNIEIDKESGFTTRSILCAPLAVKDEKIGAIEMVNKKGGDNLFTVEDLKLLETLAASASLAILNARMAAELVEKEKMRRELELAAEIQKSLLPADGEPDSPVAGVNLPARVVSGDFFDFFVLDDGRTCFTLADVSGKGMNAALLMAKTASLFRCLGKETPYPGILIAKINAEINETATRGMFVTMLVGVYDPETGTVRFANAGHEPPLLHHPDGSVDDFEASMPPVGVLPDIGMGKTPVETTINLEGGAFYIFTDGVTEGYIGEEELGAEGFNNLIKKGKELLPAERINGVATHLKEGSELLRDDVTILVVDDGAAFKERTANKAQGKNRAETDVIYGHRHGHGPGNEEIAKISVPARPESLKIVRRVVEGAVASCGLGKDTVQDIVLCVDEACQNVIRHAYAGIKPEKNKNEMIISVSSGQQILIIGIRDFAPRIDPDKVHPRELDDVRPGGLGTHFINEVMDKVEFKVPEDGHKDNRGNLLVLSKSLK
ncbi:MAG: SpoIIE family protein phosphatase [Rhodospirillaceae bacterium]|nr:SpoIIE family protein phosphatase [Rhodospirillaceae bacterium]